MMLEKKLLLMSFNTEIHKANPIFVPLMDQLVKLYQAYFLKVSTAQDQSIVWCVGSFLPELLWLSNRLIYSSSTPAALSTHPTSSNNKHSINLTCLYSLSCLSRRVHFTLCVFSWYVTPSPLTFHTVCNYSWKYCITPVCLCLCVGFWVFIMFSITVSFLFCSLCLRLIDGGFKQDSALPDCYQKLVEYSAISCTLVSSGSH